MGFDIGLDLQGHSKTAICLRFSGANRRLGIRATDPLARRINPVLKGFEGARHTVERQLYALRTLGKFSGDSTPIMPKLDDGPEIESPYVAIAVGAGQPWKAYPHWHEVASSLIQNGKRIVFIGGPEELAPSLAGASDLVGRLSLPETMAVICRSAVTLAADTGAGHIAAAYGVPVVSIFGPTDPEEFRPYTAKGVVLKEGDKTGAVSPAKVVEAAMRFCDQ